MMGQAVIVKEMSKKALKILVEGLILGFFLIRRGQALRGRT